MSEVRRALVVVVALLGAACSGESAPDATTRPGTSTDPTTSSTVPTTVPATAAITTTTIEITTTTAATTTTTVPYPTTTVHSVPVDCDVPGLLSLVDATVELARLEPGGSWETDGTTTFDEHTNDAEEFRDRLALDCRLRAAQRTPAGDRLLIAAWTGDRRAFVVQAADGPSAPYSPDQRIQLLFEQPDGEWLVDQEVWAGTLDGGDTVVVAVDDYSLGATAKAWQALPRWEDIPVSIDTERDAIDVLHHAGARNVSSGEPATVGSTLAAIQFVTPLGLPAVGTIAAIGDFDPTAPIVEGERSIETIDGIEVHVTRGAPESYAVASVGWSCGEYVWFIDAVWGTVEELVDWAGAVIRAAPCG